MLEGVRHTTTFILVINFIQVSGGKAHVTSSMIKISFVRISKGEAYATFFK